MINSKDYWALNWAIEKAKETHISPMESEYEEFTFKVRQAEEALERHRPPQAKVKRHAPQS